MRRNKPLKPWKPILLILLAGCLSISGCTSTAPPSEPERVMLSVDCGWQEIEDFGSGPREGRLVITDSIDDYQERHVFTGIKSPVREGIEGTEGDTAVFLERWHPNGFFGYTYQDMSQSFVTDLDVRNWLIESLESLTFSTVKNTRRETEARVVVHVLKKDNDKWTGRAYWICPDGIVLKEGAEDGYTCYYESHTPVPVDYYYISALQVKYEQIPSSFFLFCFDAQLTGPEQYRLCISSNTVHRDYTMEEARDLFSALKEGIDFTQVVNPDPIANRESCIKITEYSQGPADEEIQSKSYYLSPEGRLMLFREMDQFAYFYWNGDHEMLEYLLMWESEPVLDYSEFLKLIND